MHRKRLTMDLCAIEFPRSLKTGPASSFDQRTPIDTRTERQGSRF